jgi:phage anti-repressor protein
MKFQPIMDKEGRPCISGRDLFASFHLDMPYETWFRKMAEYDLRAHEHYTTIVCKRMNAATQTMEPVLDHLIIMPMAMEILLLQPTEGSRLMRLDLIDISLQWNDPEAVKNRLMELIEVSDEEQEDTPETEFPKADPQQKKTVTYADLVNEQKEPMTISAIASDYALSGLKLNELLECLDVQYKAYGSWHLHPEYEGKGYVVKEAHGYKDRGGIHSDSYRMKWTPKGRMLIYALLQKIGIKPRIEVIPYV